MKHHDTVRDDQFVEVVEIAPGAYTAALFENVGHGQRPVLVMRRAAVGHSDFDAVFNLNPVCDVSVYINAGAEGIIWQRSN